MKQRKSGPKSKKPGSVDAKKKDLTTTTDDKADVSIAPGEDAPAPSSEKKDDTRPVSVIATRHLKNIYGSRVIVGADKTPSGRRYDFAADQTLPVEPEDYHFILSLNRNPGPGCCGGTSAEQAQRHYFGIP